MIGPPKIPKQCGLCKHFKGILTSPGEDPAWPPEAIVYCEIFPKGIPKKIQTGNSVCQKAAGRMRSFFHWLAGLLKDLQAVKKGWIEKMRGKIGR